jgi:hypothetical protein
MRRFAGLLMLALASTLLNGCILTQLLGGVAGQGGLLGNPGQVPPAPGPLPGPIAGPLPGPGVTPPANPGTTPGTPPGLVPPATNLSAAIVQQIQTMDYDIQVRQARIAAKVRERDEYVRRSQARQPNDPNIAAEQQVIANYNTELNAEQAQLNEIIGRRNRLASGQPA